MGKRRTNLECYEIGLRCQELIKHNKEARIYAQGLKTEWINEARKRHEPGERQPCFVCGTHRHISESHHIVELAQQYDLGYLNPNQDFIWLCPNHHAIVHLLISERYKPWTVPDSTEEEIFAYYTILNQRFERLYENKY